MTHGDGTQAWPGKTLVVVGAALGSGRWLAEHVLSKGTWDHVYLVDSDRVVTGLQDHAWPFDAPLAFGRSVDTPGGIRFVLEADAKPQTPIPLTVEGADIVVCIAVPPAALEAVTRGLLEAVPAPVAVLVSVPGMRRSLAAVESEGVPRSVITGVHALNDAAAPSAFGQTIYLVPGGDDADPLVVDLVESAGAVAKVGSAEAHDRTMAVVQALTHRHLIAFADAVSRSGLSLEDDLWVARTPLFEALLGLAVRVLDTRQQAMISVIQESLGSPEQAALLRASLDRLPPSSSIFDTAELIQSVRDQFSGSFFSSLRSIAASTLNALQRTRADLAALREQGGIVGLARTGSSQIHVGRILELSSTTVLMEELLVGRRGQAALLHEDGVKNARYLGVVQNTKRTSLSLGHITVLSAAELNSHLENWLRRVPRDVRFLVPESVSGAGVLQAVREVELVSDAELIDEVVRTGQRSVVIRFGIRADRSVEASVEQVREHIASVYRWPLGVTRDIEGTDIRRIAYLGPAGTFSEAAAAQLAAGLGTHEVRTEDVASFDEVLRAVAQNAIGVMPISSSASGLVTRAVKALLATETDVVAGGVIDVAVRFDAYALPGVALDSLRGAVVYSHPQGLAQCQNYIRRMKLQPVETSSTSSALEQAATSTEPALALAGEGKGRDYGLETLEREVDDLSGSITRFLVIGGLDAFGTFESGSLPTLRSLWIGDDVRTALVLLAQGSAGFDELLSDSEGNFALITSRDLVGPDSATRVRYLGTMPWSPRTPIVRPD